MTRGGFRNPKELVISGRGDLGEGLLPREQLPLSQSSSLAMQQNQRRGAQYCQRLMVLDMAVKFIFNAVKSDLATQGRGLSEGVTDAVTQGAALRCAVLVMEKLSRSLMLATAVLIGLYKLVHNRSWLRSLVHSWRCCLPPALMAALAVAKQSPVLLAVAAVLSAPRRQQQPSRQVALDISTSNPVTTSSAVYSLVPVLYMSVPVHCVYHYTSQLPYNTTSLRCTLLTHT